MRRMFKAGLLFLIFITATIYCQSAQEKWQTKEILVKSANIKLLLKYRGSGLTYFDYTDKEYKELLNVIKLFYTDRDSEHYLGEITRTGVYDVRCKRKRRLCIAGKPARFIYKFPKFIVSDFNKLRKI